MVRFDFGVGNAYNIPRSNFRVSEPINDGDLEWIFTYHNILKYKMQVFERKSITCRLKLSIKKLQKTFMFTLV